MDAKRLKKSSSGPNTRLGRKMVASGNASLIVGLAGGLGARVFRGRGGIGADRRHVEQVGRAGLRRGARDAVGRCHVDGVEGLAAAFVEDAGEIDDRVGACDGAADRGLVPHVGQHRNDLADIAAGAQETGKLRPPGRDPNAAALLRQPLDDVAPEEARFRRRS